MVLSNFVERLKEFTVLENLTATELSKRTNIDRSTLSGLLRGEHLPKFEVFCKLITYFNCSADYLLGFSNDYPEEKQYLPPVENFGDRFYFLLKQTGTSQYELTKNENISSNLLYQWLHNQTKPSVYNLVKLANYMEITIDYLLGREN